MRPSTPKKVKDAVLKEFNYKCAICGTERPHLHHIDENPSNNVVDNLIPLCPNCHLKDQHNSSSFIPFLKLKLFRTYKDLSILSPKFHPLYERIKYLYKIEKLNYKELLAKSKELLEFVSLLNMGDFYKKEIRKLIRFTELVPLTYDSEREDLGYKLRYKEKLTNNCQRVLELVMEMLPYQNWNDK